MFEQWYGPEIGSDREYLLSRGVFPALGTVAVMALTFSVVAGVLFVAEGIILGSVVTQILALTVMYALPPFVVGLWVGNRDGLLVAPAIAAGVAPIVVLVVTLGAFGGPVTTPFERPLLLLGAVAAWSVLCGLGILTGVTVLAPQLSE